MLNELLISLSGCKGLLFSTELPTNLDFLHPGEEEILSKILILGRYAAQFQEFVETFDISTLIKNHLNADISTFGYYEAAFAEGLKEILAEYRGDLCRLETNFRTTPTCRNLLYVNSELQKYFLAFPVVELALGKVKNEHVRGCILLNIVYENSSLGIPSVNEFFEKIRQSCNRLFANHLLEWLKFGLIIDKYNEFFIQKGDNERFLLRSELCPCFLSKNLSEKIFFIGDKISLVRKEPRNFDSFTTLLDENCIEIRSILIGNGFDSTQLESPIEKIRKALSEKLWTSIVNSTDNNGESLFYCLNLIKDYFFLGKGELYLTMIDEIDEKSIEKNTDLNKILQNVTAKLYGGDGSTISNEVFRMNFRKFGDVSTPVNDWERYLELSLELSSKLKLIFNDDLLLKCRKIFFFLFKIRRVQTGLNKSWTFLLKRRRSKKLFPSSSSSVVEAKVWRINNLMLFLVNNLQYYLHVDVLDSFYKILLTALNRNVNEFQRAAELLNDFVRKICVSCFLESKEITKIIEGVMNDCEKFTILTLNDDEHDVDRAEKVQEIFVAYERHASLLFKVLSKPKMHTNNPHLSQLLHRLDFNSYFSSTNLF